MTNTVRSVRIIRVPTSDWFLLFVFLSVGCASLLPPERRVYPKNPVTLPEGMDIHQWIETKKNQYLERFWSDQVGESEYKFNYIRKNLTSFGSYVSCSAMIRNSSLKQLELYNLVSMVNYADYTKFMRKGGDLGPMNEKERTEILLPCIEEFLEPPQPKE
ncbi:hypothetical protein EHR01_18210 [Leptospira mtsangambouensis]|uniref:DUF4296 domain-containing protein n=1 Tax=Leptospira mtsangambouensis TaxID=2484912 RepID=A0ABY2NXD9_9LEPT|nr:hypothetical protein [Leptospira mtsangambouensis]TGM73138.1 hypothetical protein EHR01_18210 [Leptospira mtsangambouensis]